MSAVSFIHFRSAGYFRWRIAVPFILLSIPMSFLGARIHVQKEVFFFLLGTSLLVAALQLLINDSKTKSVQYISNKKKWIVGLPLGAVLGFISGLIGIGGGIFLSPLFLFMRWTNAKEAAAIASFFILVNSGAGVLGQYQKGSMFLVGLGFLVGAVFFGGQIGALFSSRRLSVQWLLRGLAGLIFYTSIQLILRAI